MTKDRILINESKQVSLMQGSVETFASNCNALYAEAKRLDIALPALENIRPLLGAMLRKDFSNEHIAFSRLLDACELKTDKLISLGAGCYAAHKQFSQYLIQDSKGITINQPLLENFYDANYRCYADLSEQKAINFGIDLAENLKALRDFREKNGGKGMGAFTYEQNSYLSLILK